MASWRSLLQKGKIEKGTEWIRRAWHEGSFSEGLEKKFIRSHKNLLSQLDHEIRLDNLLWRKDAVYAIRMLDRVSSDKKKLAIARIR
ncbi:hypothetical protein [Sneathiella glossodoripedis]|uniref:hypothetical protein n=1 Tax=Sneathiella glossodoripedis TaxID=418853 RepID=UPI00056CC47E|nr:hypothetical protein [Sneathiella glossodoripedis]